MEESPKKYCVDCRAYLPATTDYFFPSYLKDGTKARNLCRVHHNARKANSKTVPYRIKLREQASPIDPKDLPLYRSINSVAVALGLSVAVVEHDIFAKKIPVHTFLYNNVGPALAISMKDALAYIDSHERNGNAPQKTDQIGTVDRCGCCGEGKSNILAVHDKDQVVRAYLCSPCYRAAKSFAWDPTRLRAIAKILETIGPLDPPRR